MKTSPYGTVLAKVSLAPVARATDSAFNGTTVDRAQYMNNSRSASVVVVTGAVTDGDHAITLEVSSNGSDWAAAAAADIQGSLPTLTSASDNVVLEFGYTGSERYLRVVSTASSTTSGGIYSALILLSGSRRKPIARA